MQKTNSNHTIVCRFLDTTPLSSNISSTFRTIILQLNHIYFKDELCELESLDSVQLNKILFNRLKIIEEKFKDERILIFLDSLDQLNRIILILIGLLRIILKILKLFILHYINMVK